MKVVFLQDVKDVGNKGDVKEVATGHARNFLFPHGLAKPASKEALAELEAEKKRRALEAEADLHRTEALIQKLDGYELELSVGVSSAGTLYAAVTAERVLDALRAKGFAIGRGSVQLPEGAPIKEAGEYEAVVNLDHGLEAEIRIIVSA